MNSPSSPWKTVVLHHGITLALCAVLFAAGVWGYLEFSGKALLGSRGLEGSHGVEGWNAMESPVRYQMAAKRARIAQALGAYHLSRGSYPSSLEQLIQDDFLPPGALHPTLAGLRFDMAEQGDALEVVIVEDDSKGR